MAVFPRRGNGRGAGGGSDLTGEYWWKHCFKWWSSSHGLGRGVGFLCVLQTLVGGRGHCRTRRSEPDCDQCRETVSLLHTSTAKREKQASRLLLSEKHGRLSGKLGHTFLFCEPHPEALLDKNKSCLLAVCKSSGLCPSQTSLHVSVNRTRFRREDGQVCMVAALAPALLLPILAAVVREMWGCLVSLKNLYSHPGWAPGRVAEAHLSSLVGSTCALRSQPGPIASAGTLPRWRHCPGLFQERCFWLASS